MLFLKSLCYNNEFCDVNTVIVLFITVNLLFEQFGLYKVLHKKKQKVSLVFVKDFKQTLDLTTDVQALFEVLFEAHKSAGSCPVSCEAEADVFASHPDD